MNRIREIAPEQLTPEQKTVFEQLTAGRGRILAPYKVWIHSPTVASGMEHIGTFLNKRSSLSPREVEIGILVIAHHWQGDYVLQAHIREGKKVGLSQETIDAIIAGASNADMGDDVGARPDRAIAEIELLHAPIRPIQHMLDRDPLIAAFDAQNDVLAIGADEIDVGWDDAGTEMDLVLVGGITAHVVDDRVLAVAARDEICIVARASLEHVVAESARNDVVARPGDDGVVPRAAEDVDAAGFGSYHRIITRAIVARRPFICDRRVHWIAEL